MPTKEQIEQEERDMALARQLQAEEEQVQQQQRQMAAQQHHQQSAHHSMASPSHPAGTTVTLTCPQCRALNHIAIAQQGLQHMCGMCHRLLPPATGAQPSQASRAVPAPGAAGTTQLAQMQCPACTTMNQVQRNMHGPTQFVCGACRTMLTMPAPAPAPAPMAQQQHAAPGGGGGIEQGVLIHKVRCGGCQSVNQVKGGSGTQFRCGSCQAINEIP